MLCRDAFETRTLQQIKQQAKAQWALWRLVFDAGMDYNTVFHQMSVDEVEQANAAYDLYISAQKRSIKK